MDTSITEHTDFEVINGRKVVRKHVAAIHCSNKLSLLERKISNALLYNAFPNLKKKVTFQLSIDQLKRLLGCVTRNHKFLKQALKTLISTVLEWNLLSDDVSDLDLEGWNASSILASVSIKNGIITYQYSESIKELLSDPKIYGKINLNIQARFKSAYALALYENCSRYRGLPSTKDFDYTVLRKLLGVDEEKYNIFYEFNKRVLAPAVNEINSCSDIRIIPKITKRGRKIISIRFELGERALMKRLGGQDTAKNKKLISTLESDFDMDSKDVKSLLSRFGEERIQSAISYVTSRPGYANGTINNVAGYFKSAVVNGYSETKGELKLDHSKEKIEVIKYRKEENRKKELLNEKYKNYIVTSIIKEYSTNGLLQEKSILSNFLYEKHYHIRNTELFYEKICETSGDVLSAVKDENIYVRVFFESGFANYIWQKHKNKMKGDYLNYEAFVAQENDY